MSAACFICGDSANAKEMICTGCVEHKLLGGAITLSQKRRFVCPEGDCGYATDDNDEMHIHLNANHPLIRRMREKLAANHDAVARPAHYTAHASGVECIQITEHMNFCLGNAIKYIWRAGSKGSRIEDLRKARWYIDRELERLDAEALKLQE